MAQAVAFYCDGLALTLVMQSSGWSMLACGDALIGLHLIEGGVDERPVPYAGLNLLVDDLEAAIDRAVAHGARLVALREPDAPGSPAWVCSSHRAATASNFATAEADRAGFDLRPLVRLAAGSA